MSNEASQTVNHQAVAYQQQGNIAVITLNNPPVNGLSHLLRAGIVAGIQRAENDVGIRAVVLVGTDAGFSAGADISEFGKRAMSAEPSLPAVIDVIENSAKPVVAAISGNCMGGGLELALSCHYRVVHAAAQIALPEVKLGLLPGAGGTQRLPRLIGVEAALNMIVSGAIVPAPQFKGSPLFDHFVDDKLLEQAIEFAHKVVSDGKPLKRVRDLKVKHAKPDAFFQFARNMVGAMSKGYPAPLKCVEAVQASLLPSFDAGLKVERDLFAQLLMSDESKALRHLFFSERLASKIADLPEDTAVRTIKSVGVIGAGTMGSGIAINFLNAGIPVVILETKQEALDRGMASVGKVYESQVKKGKMKPEKAQERVALLKGSLLYDDLKDVDLVIEAVFEELGVKEAVFKKLDAVCKPGAILASNTSTLDLNKIAGFTQRPQDVVGAHFFSPANVMKLLEVVRGEKTAPDVLATMMKLAKKIKKTAVVSGVCDGFIGNRMIGKYAIEAQLLLEQGASVQQIDSAMEKFGMAMGPFKMGDLAGNDIGWAIRKRFYAENPGARRQLISDHMCELGRFGQKTGAGWYRYETGKRDALQDPIIDELVNVARQELGITPRKISADEIVERLVYALVNEGAHILEEGIAQRASDIDMVYIFGYGFPVPRGGPMFYADSVGLLSIERRMAKFGWTPAPLLKRLALEGKTFN